MPPENGTAAPPGWLTSIESTPVSTFVATGLVVSVKPPKVPRPATATAAPTAAMAPTIFTAERLRVVVCCRWWSR